MIRRLVLAGCLLTVLAPLTHGQTLLAKNPIPTRAALERTGLERGWYAAAPIIPGREGVVMLDVAEDLLFVQSDQANLHAYEAETGRLLWSANLGRPTKKAQPISMNSTQVFATNGERLLGIDRRTGNIVWVQRLEAFATSATAADETVVMVGLNSGRLVAYHLQKPVTSPFERERGTPGGFAWAWRTNAPISSRPITTKFVVAFASEDGKLYVARILPSLLLHRSQSFGTIKAPLGRYGNRTLLVPTFDHNVYAIDLFTGDQYWVYGTGAPVNQEPLVSGKEVFVVNTKGSLVALDADTGIPFWNPTEKQTEDGELLAISKDRLYLRTPYGDLNIFDRHTGRLVADARATFERNGLDLRDYRVAFTNDENDRIYLATTGGQILCLRELGQSTPHPLRDPNEPIFGIIPDERDLSTTPPDVPPVEGEGSQDAFPGSDPMEEPQDPDESPF